MGGEAPLTKGKRWVNLCIPKENHQIMQQENTKLFCSGAFYATLRQIKKDYPPMPFVFRAPFFKALPALLALPFAACFGMGDDDAPKLQGDRIDVTMQPTVLQATQGAETEPFMLPEARENINWSQVAGNASHYPQHVAIPASVVRAWTASVGSGSAFGKGKLLLNPPVINAGRLFALTTDGEVTALDAKTGKRVWNVELPLKEQELAKMSGGLAVSGDLLFVTTGSGQVFALSASAGKKVWETDLAVPVRAAPTVQGERLYIVSHDNRTFGLSALDGSLLWTHSGMEETLTLAQAAAPAAGNGLVAVPYSSGEIYVLRATDGRYVWHDALTSPFSGQDPESTVTSIAAEPVMADGLLYVVGLNGGLSAYGIANGQRFWRADIVTSQMPWVSGLHIFALTDKGELVGLNRRDGSIRWVSDLNKGLPEGKRLWVGPVLAGGRLMVASNDGYALSVNPESGARIAASELGSGVSMAPIVSNNALYFFTDDGEVIAFMAAK